MSNAPSAPDAAAAPPQALPPAADASAATRSPTTLPPPCPPAGPPAAGPPPGAPPHSVTPQVPATRPEAPPPELVDDHDDDHDDDRLLSGWGRVPVPGYERRSEDLETLTEGAVLCRGLGRSYGDSALPPPGLREVAGTTLADRVLGFDQQTGILRAEAGLSLKAINELFLNRRWFVPVSPGTQFVTLGGMVAADIHGKNHHVKGTFGQHVTGLKLRVPDGRILEIAPNAERELFDATLGGMGLTGHILEVEFKMERLPTSWILQETERVPDLDAFLGMLDQAKDRWPATMGWIDCLSRGSKMGRGVLYRGRWASPDEAPQKLPKPKRRLTMPFDLPGFALNPLSIKAFNALKYTLHGSKVRRKVVHPESFYYPLDSIRLWNRLYGKRGFTQYQCVLPRHRLPMAAHRFMELLTRLGGASFLCVIKDCGPEGRGMLSFPMEGVSIALDIPMRAGTQDLVDQLNRFVIDEGGRIYLAKDLLTRAQDFAAMEGERLQRFHAVRVKWDPQARLRSAQSVRLMGDLA